MKFSQSKVLLFLIFAAPARHWGAFSRCFWNESRACLEGGRSQLSVFATPVSIRPSIFPFFTFTLVLTPQPTGPPHPPTPTSHGPLSALGWPEALPIVAFGDSEKSEEIPVAFARAGGLLGFPLAHSEYSVVRLYRTSGLRRFLWLCLFT